MRTWLGLILVGLMQQAFANAPCDASIPIKGCRAEVRLDGNFVVLSSSTTQCSVIEWTIDGRGRQTTVIDGEERLELLTTKPNQLSVESCTQVKDLRAIGRSDGGRNDPQGPTTFQTRCTVYNQGRVIDYIDGVNVTAPSSAEPDKALAVDRACEQAVAEYSLRKRQENCRRATEKWFIEFCKRRGEL